MPKGRKEMKNMKKNIFKKIVASLATVAMAAGLFTAMPAEEAKAATNVKIYVKVDGATSYGVNAWGGVNVSGGAKVNTWQNDDKTWQTHPSLQDAGDGWGYVTLDDSTKVEGLQVVKEKNPLKVGGSDNIWNSEIEAQNLTEAYFKDGKWYKEKACTTEIKPPVLDDVYYVLGDKGLTGADWQKGPDGITPSTGKMTANGSDYSVKFTNVAASTYGYKILQDPEDFGWNNAYTKESAGSKTEFNGSITVAKKSDVTISINKDTKIVTVTVTEVKETESKPAESKPAESKPAESKPAESKPAESKPAESKPAESKPAESSKPSETNKPDVTTKDQETTTEAKKGIEVEVTLSADAKWDKVYLYAFPEGEGLKGWPGVEMTAKDGKWYATLDTTATKLSYVISNGNGEQTVDVKDVEGKNVKITLGAKNAEGKFEASAKTVTVDGTGTAKPGDSAPIVMMFAVAAVAVGMVVASKKKTICE